jgi:short subunit dehydrogenase-like uncharacterized protein
LGKRRAVSALVVYGATGYTGRLILAHARARGLDVIAAGRDEERLAALGGPYRVASLGDPAAFAGAHVVINAAGPFHLTAAPVLEACLKVGAHYLDVGGEGRVFEALARYGERARRAGVMVMPGAGYVMAASDALAAHVAGRLPEASRLWLGFSRADPISRGSLASMLELADGRVTIRRNGRLVSVRAGSLSRAFDFGAGASPAMLAPWPDPFSAWLTTRIPNIEAYLEADALTQGAYRAASLFAPALKPMARVLAASWPEGPSEAEREAAPKVAVAEAEDVYRRRVTARLITPNVYSFTRDCVVALAERALARDAPPGFRTPAGAYGPDFALALPGVWREEG